MNSDRLVNMKLAGKEYPALLSLRAIKKLDELTKINLIGKVNILELTADQLATLLWVALNVRKVDDRWINDYNEPVVTLDQVYDLVDFRDLVDVYLNIALLLNVSMTKVEKAEADPKA